MKILAAACTAAALLFTTGDARAAPTGDLDRYQSGFFPDADTASTGERYLVTWYGRRPGNYGPAAGGIHPGGLSGLLATFTTDVATAQWDPGYGGDSWMLDAGVTHLFTEMDQMTQTRAALPASSPLTVTPPEAPQVTEPSTALLVGSALFLIAIYSKRRRKA